MRTKMKKLISIGTIPVLTLTLLLVFGTVLADSSANQAPKPAPSLLPLLMAKLLFWRGICPGKSICRFVFDEAKGPLTAEAFSEGMQIG